jgi:hypothetical protein
MTRFEEVMAALSARANVYPSEPEQKNLVQAEFLQGAATAFALCLRGEENTQCLKAAKALASNILTAEQAPRAGDAEKKGQVVSAVETAGS